MRNVSGHEYIVEESPDATPEQRHLRDGWLMGTTSWTERYV